jgi:hypothetical protein
MESCKAHNKKAKNLEQVCSKGNIALNTLVILEDISKKRKRMIVITNCLHKRGSYKSNLSFQQIKI